jgi:lipopolysaccharide biosynthesis glycosyltransferase
LTIKVFIGWDPEHAEAAEVCRHSLLKHSTVPLQIEFLKQSELREAKHYWREDDSGCSTEYTYTRYLVPHLMEYSGLAVYVDAGFVFLDDVRELLQHYDSRAAVHVVKHQYKPKNTTKLVDREQHVYPRKNWSSLMLWNCAHPDLRTLTAEAVSTQSAQWLHRFEFIPSSTVHSLNPDWNWLVDWYHEPDDGTPRALHFTEGGPWLKNHRQCKYGWYWAQAYHDWQRSQISAPMPGVLDSIPPDIERLFLDVLEWRVDPGQQYNQVAYEDLTAALSRLNNRAAVAVEADTVFESSDKLEAKGHNYDPFLKSFIMGSGGQITVWDKTSEDTTPVILRGVTKRKHMAACEAKGRDYYYIDTGYFGNGRKKTYHRITRNAMQATGPVIKRPRDRLSATGWAPRKFRPGSHILLAPPSQKLLMCYDIDLEQWLKDTVDQLRLFTDREIIIRNKASRSVRQSSDTIEMALERNVHCLVTFSSIAAVEAVLYGKPAITLGPSAAHAVTSHEIRDIEKPYIPTLDEVEEWAAHLAYCQFTEAEMRDGTAWHILTDRDDT